MLFQVGFFLRAWQRCLHAMPLERRCLCMRAHMHQASLLPLLVTCCKSAARAHGFTPHCPDRCHHWPPG
jgi:hypothetical protein